MSSLFRADFCEKLKRQRPDRRGEEDGHEIPQCVRRAALAEERVERLLEPGAQGHHEREADGALEQLAQERGLDLKAYVPAVELEANRAVWRNVPVRTLLPGREELKALDFRSKKELAGQVRLVEIEGVDLCACCAPHVAHTGEVGLIKVLDSVRRREGTRLTVLAGEAAFHDCAAVYVQNSAVSAALSAKRLETAAAVRRVLCEKEEEHSAVTELKKELLRVKAAALRPTEGNMCIFEPDMDAVTLRELVNAGVAVTGGVCAAFSGADGDYRYIIGSRSVDLRSAAREINAAISGRGGGTGTMIQGSCRASRAEIEQYFASAAAKFTDY